MSSRSRPSLAPEYGAFAPFFRDYLIGKLNSSAILEHLCQQGPRQNRDLAEVWNSALRCSHLLQLISTGMGDVTNRFCRALMRNERYYWLSRFQGTTGTGTQSGDSPCLRFYQPAIDVYVEATPVVQVVGECIYCLHRVTLSLEGCEVKVLCNHETNGSSRPVSSRMGSKCLLVVGSHKLNHLKAYNVTACDLNIKAEKVTGHNMAKTLVIDLTLVEMLDELEANVARIVARLLLLSVVDMLFSLLDSTKRAMLGHQLQEMLRVTTCIQHVVVDLPLLCLFNNADQLVDAYATCYIFHVAGLLDSSVDGISTYHYGEMALHVTVERDEPELMGTLLAQSKSTTVGDCMACMPHERAERLKRHFSVAAPTDCNSKHCMTGASVEQTFGEIVDGLYANLFISMDDLKHLQSLARQEDKASSLLLKTLLANRRNLFDGFLRYLEETGRCSLAFQLLQSDEKGGTLSEKRGVTEKPIITVQCYSVAFLTDADQQLLYKEEEKLELFVLNLSSLSRFQVKVHCGGKWEGVGKLNDLSRVKVVSKDPKIACLPILRISADKMEETGQQLFCFIDGCVGLELGEKVIEQSGNYKFAQISLRELLAVVSRCSDIEFRELVKCSLQTTLPNVEYVMLCVGDLVPLLMIGDTKMLHRAIRVRDSETVFALLQPGINSDRQAPFHIVPLHVADNEQGDCIHSFYQHLFRMLNPCAVLDHLYQDGLMMGQQLQELTKRLILFDQFYFVLKLILSSVRDAFDHLCRVLAQNENRVYLLSRIYAIQSIHKMVHATESMEPFNSVAQSFGFSRLAMDVYAEETVTKMKAVEEHVGCLQHLNSSPDSFEIDMCDSETTGPPSPASSRMVSRYVLVGSSHKFARLRLYDMIPCDIYIKPEKVSQNLAQSLAIDVTLVDTFDQSIVRVTRHVAKMPFLSVVDMLCSLSDLSESKMLSHQLGKTQRPALITNLLKTLLSDFEYVMSWIGRLPPLLIFGDTETLYSTCRKGVLETAFVFSQADINSSQALGGQRLLQVAASKDFGDIASLLIGYRVDVDTMAECTFQTLPSLLYVVAFDGSSNCMVAAILLHENCENQERNGAELTPLLRASYIDHVDILELVLSAGYDKATRNKISNGALPLSEIHYLLESVEVLVLNGFSFNEKHSERQTFFYMSCVRGHLSVCKFLVQTRFVTDCMDEVISHQACREEHVAIFHVLISRRCNETARGKDNYGALDLTTFSGHLQAVRFLANSRFNVNEKHEDNPGVLAAFKQSSFLFRISLTSMRDVGFVFVCTWILFFLSSGLGLLVKARLTGICSKRVVYQSDNENELQNDAAASKAVTYEGRVDHPSSRNSCATFVEDGRFRFKTAGRTEVKATAEEEREDEVSDDYRGDRDNSSHYLGAAASGSGGRNCHAVQGNSAIRLSSSRSPAQLPDGLSGDNFLRLEHSSNFGRLGETALKLDRQSAFATHTSIEGVRLGRVRDDHTDARHVAGNGG